jgi:hypothetical protein
MNRLTLKLCAYGLLAVVMSATAGRLAALVRQQPTLLTDSPVLTLGVTAESTEADWLGGNAPPSGYTAQVVEFGTGEDVPEAYRGQRVTVFFQPPAVLGPPRPAPTCESNFRREVIPRSSSPSRKIPTIPDRWR